MKHYTRLPHRGGGHVIQPTIGQLVCMSWSVIWRYMLVSTIIMMTIYILYISQFPPVVGLIHTIYQVWEVIGESGYLIALKMYPLEIFLWFLVRIIIGVIVTYWVFTRLIILNYQDFYLRLSPISIADNNVYPLRRAILRAAWAFYWRLAAIMIMIFVASTFFINHALMLLYMYHLAGFYMFIAFLIMPYIFKMISNKPLGTFMLQVIGNK